jgi:hypothetical protein
MANKTYTVMKDGETIKELKTLAAAKKLADAEDAEVFCEGLCVYQGTAKDSEDTVSELSDAVAESPAKEPVTPVKYTLTAKMNIRKAPSKTAEIAGIAQKGTIVDVTAIEGDWMHLSDGTFILYEGGKFAVRS